MIEICECCGAKMYKYWHRLTPMLIDTLKKFHQAVIRKGANDIHVPKEVNLTKQEYNNFQKLRFHGLVAKYKSKGIHKTGHWLITRRGAQFLAGELAVPCRVQTFRNKVIDHDTKTISLPLNREILQSMPYVESIDDFEREIVIPEKKKPQFIFDNETNTVIEI
jgi:hypothetical protein